MAIKLVVTADNHLSRYYAKMPVARLEERRRWLRRAFRRVVDAAIDEHADFFLQCGDLFDTVDPRNAERSFVAGCLADLRAAGVEVLAVGGNHDSPRQSTDHGGYLAADLYARLGGLRLFAAAERLEYEVYDRGGARIAIGGLGWDARRSYGDDPLEGVVYEDPPDGRADWKLLLAHASLQDHTFPGAFEPVISRESIAQLDADILLAGHVHTRTAFEVGGTHVLVPGATERMYLDEFDHDPGFLVVELYEPGRFQHRWVTFPAQPRCRLTVTGHELTPRPVGLRAPEIDPTELVIERIEAEGDGDCITTLALEGPVPREVYGALDFVRIQEAGAAANFFFEVDTTALEPQSELGERTTRGVRLSQVEELHETAAALRDAAVSDGERRLVTLGLERVLAYYHQGDSTG